VNISLAGCNESLAATTGNALIAKKFIAGKDRGEEFYCWLVPNEPE
jgi:hypothetical protein